MLVIVQHENHDIVWNAEKVSIHYYVDGFIREIGLHYIRNTDLINNAKCVWLGSQRLVFDRRYLDQERALIVAKLALESQS